MVGDDGAFRFLHCVVNESGDLLEVGVFERRVGNPLEIAHKRREPLPDARRARRTLTARGARRDVLVNRPSLCGRQATRAVEFELPC